MCLIAIGTSFNRTGSSSLVELEQSLELTNSNPVISQVEKNGNPEKQTGGSGKLTRSLLFT